MPGGDQTGPMGQGPTTGRGMGYCSGSQQPGFMSSGGSKGMRRRGGGGRGFGGGRGRCLQGQDNQYAPTVRPTLEKSDETSSASMAASIHDRDVAELKEKNSQMEATLRQIQSQLADLSKKASPQ